MKKTLIAAAIAAPAMAFDFDRGVLPDGYKAVQAAEGIIEVQKYDGGKWVTDSYHIAEKQTVLQYTGVDGKPVQVNFVPVSDDNKDIYQDSVDRWNAGEEGEKLPSFGEGANNPEDGQLPGMTHPSEQEDGQLPEFTNPSEGQTERPEGSPTLGAAIDHMVKNDQVLAEYISQVNEQTNARIDQNELDIQNLYGHVNRLDERIDAIGATAQAVTAARPILGSNHTSAVGVGLGYMGAATALSVGYSHQINTNWSANANVATTMGVEDNDFSMGAGVQFAW
uniref:YadA C-terminal domain-containing protein n=1 Tax=Thaumasiovibrio occultus TaxID=1891184 RepID=UPI000B358005|nr:YadA C-terminal domain-containing protein [Thaumasiovibrio occultus]